MAGLEALNFRNDGRRVIQVDAFPNMMPMWVDIASMSGTATNSMKVWRLPFIQSTVLAGSMADFDSNVGAHGASEMCNNGHPHRNRICGTFAVVLDYAWRTHTVGRTYVRQRLKNMTPYLLAETDFGVMLDCTKVLADQVRFVVHRPSEMVASDQARPVNRRLNSYTSSPVSAFMDAYYNYTMKDSLAGLVELVMRNADRYEPLVPTAEEDRTPERLRGYCHRTLTYDQMQAQYLTGNYRMVQPATATQQASRSYRVGSEFYVVVRDSVTGLTPIRREQVAPV